MRAVTARFGGRALSIMYNMRRNARRPGVVRRPPPLSPELLRLVERAYRDRERDARNIVARCRRLYPEYAALSGAALQGLWQNVRYLVGGFYQFNLVGGRSPTLKELQLTIAAAQARAAQGVPLGAMIGTYQLALPILWEHLIETVEPHPSVRMELLRRVPVTFASINRVTTVVTEAYLAERERLLRSRGEAITEFVRLLMSADTPLGTVEARARELGLDVDAPRVAILFRRAHKDGRRGSDAEAVSRLRGLCEAQGDAIVARVEEAVLALLPRAAQQAVLTEFAATYPRLGWNAGVGSAAADVGGLRRSALEARRAIELGMLLRRPSAVHSYADLVLHDLVDAGSTRAQTFAQQVLGALARPGTRRIYYATLRALCAEGFRAKPAAAALGIHPHTLSYRLKQIQRRYGLDVGNAHTRLRIVLALLILDT